MRELLESFARALHTDRSDEEYDYVVRRLEVNFRKAVTEAVCELLDPPNPQFRHQRLARAVRKAVMEPPGRE